MVNYDILFAVIFYAILFLYYLTHKEKFVVQGKIFVMYRTKLGIQMMDTMAKAFPRLLTFLGYCGVLVGFIGMGFIFYILVKGTFNLLTVENAVPVIAPVLPGVSIPGLPSLSFWHWILSILIVATIHEFSHGILARVHGIKVKSSGFAFLGPILAAFVEPDEEEMGKSAKKKQLSVFAAGPFSNLLTGVVFLLISAFIFSPIASSMVNYEGVQVVSVEEGLPAAEAGLKAGDVITHVNGISVTTTQSFTRLLSETKPGDTITITTSERDVTVISQSNPNDSNRSYIGIFISSVSTHLKEEVITKYGWFLPSAVLWTARLMEWLFLISVGIGLANLLPLGPVDGGRMMHTGLSTFIKHQSILTKTWMSITIFTLVLIFINLWPYILKLLLFLFGPFVALF